jgi:hypothetical protein
MSRPESDRVNLTLLIVLFVLSGPLYFLLGRSLFGGWEGFFEACVAVIRPDIISAASGNYHDDRAGRFTLLLYLLICAAIVAAEYHVVARFILGIENPWG